MWPYLAALLVTGHGLQYYTGFIYYLTLSLLHCCLQVHFLLARGGGNRKLLYTGKMMKVISYVYHHFGFDSTLLIENIIKIYHRSGSIVCYYMSVLI